MDNATLAFISAFGDIGKGVLDNLTAKQKQENEKWKLQNAQQEFGRILQRHGGKMDEQALSEVLSSQVPGMDTQMDNALNLNRLHVQERERQEQAAQRKEQQAETARLRKSENARLAFTAQKGDINPDLTPDELSSVFDQMAEGRYSGVVSRKVRKPDAMPDGQYGPQDPSKTHEATESVAVKTQPKQKLQVVKAEYDDQGGLHVTYIDPETNEITQKDTEGKPWFRASARPKPGGGKGGGRKVSEEAYQKAVEISKLPDAMPGLPGASPAQKANARGIIQAYKNQQSGGGVDWNKAAKSLK